MKTTTVLLIILTLSFAGCTNNTAKKNEKGTNLKCENWQDVLATMKQADTAKTYNFFIEKFGKPLDEYATPTLPEEYVIFFQVPGQPDSAFWVMLDTKTKKYLYWSTQECSKNGCIRNEKKTIYDYTGYKHKEIQGFIDALRSGDQKLIQSLCTKEGYKSLKKIIPADQQDEYTYKNISNDLTIAEFRPGVSEECVEYCDFYFTNNDGKWHYTLGFMGLKEGYKFQCIKIEKDKTESQ